MNMEKAKVVILCGGRGTRLHEETEFRPKPMVLIGNRPILWHIMKTYSYYGYKDFILCLGYKGYMIKEYFLNYELINNDFTIELGGSGKVEVHSSHPEHDWRVTLADTGINSMTGARIKKIERYVDSNIFMITYGDAVTDLNIKKLVSFHKAHGRIATVTGVSPSSRFGELVVKNNQVVEFSEKPQTKEGLINGGFFVCDRRLFEYVSEDEDCIFERQPLERLAREEKLMVYVHKGFWQCMDTYRDMQVLNSYWDSDNPPWKFWED